MRSRERVTPLWRKGDGEEGPRTVDYHQLQLQQRCEMESREQRAV